MSLFDKASEDVMDAATGIPIMLAAPLKFGNG